MTPDPTSPALQGLVATAAGVGDPAQDSSTGAATSATGIGAGTSDLTLDFGFVPAPAPLPDAASP